MPSSTQPTLADARRAHSEARIAHAMALAGRPLELEVGRLLHWRGHCPRFLTSADAIQKVEADILRPRHYVGLAVWGKAHEYSAQCMYNGRRGPVLRGTSPVEAKLRAFIVHKLNFDGLQPADVEPEADGDAQSPTPATEWL
jgi:hypothetical protein